MYPFFFGPSAAPLFGAYHAPTGPARSATRAVVLCYPLGHEYIRVHRTFRNLAEALSQAGCHVLRFDYHGVGDSAGHAVETSLRQCLEDIDLTVQELKDMSGAQLVSLVGLRLGGILAAEAATRRADIDRLLTWDPVASGATYLRELGTLHRRWIETRPWTQQRDESGARELIGFPWSADLESELAQLTVDSLAPTRARQASIVVSQPVEHHEAYQRWIRYLGVAGAGTGGSVRVVEAPGHWDEPEHAHRIFLAHAAVTGIVEVLERS